MKWEKEELNWGFRETNAVANGATMICDNEDLNWAFRETNAITSNTSMK